MKTKQQFLFLIILATLFQLVACRKASTTPISTVATPTQTPDLFVLTPPAHLLSQAEALLNEGKCTEALPILNNLIEHQPDWLPPYEYRASCNLAFKSNVFTEAQGYLLAALRDVNALIELQPTAGGYYAWRNYILREMAPLEINSVNRFAIYDLANQDVVKAMELGVDSSSYAYRHYARNLIEGNHCKEGLAETQKLIDQAGMQSNDFGQYYSLYLTEAYMCLGELDKALESSQYITCYDDPVGTCKSGLQAEIYFQSGNYEKALATINSMINEQPVGGGWRYFIRAFIYYEQGKTELTLQDLELGDAYSWYGNGVYWYMKARLAIEAGDEENGIQYLQNAEQTLDVTYMPLRQKIIRELKTYGEEPVVLDPNLPFTLPPIP